jgi:hypothetical protein
LVPVGSDEERPGVGRAGLGCLRRELVASWQREARRSGSIILSGSSFLAVIHPAIALVSKMRRRRTTRPRSDVDMVTHFFS